MSDLIYGRNAVLEAVSSGIQIEKVCIQNTLRGEFEVQLRHLCSERNIPLARVPDVKLQDLARGKVHQGVLAFISPVSFADFKVIAEQSISKGVSPLFIVAEGITDIRNIGAMARSARYFGADALIIAGNISGRIHEDAIKASAGALLSLPVCRASSIFHLISDLQSLGIKVLATSLQNGSSPDQIGMVEPVAIIMGSEEKGLHQKILDIVDDILCIPGSGLFDSLNVSVATGIILYEVSRQRASLSSLRK